MSQPRNPSQPSTLTTRPASSASGNFFSVDWRCVQEAARHGDGVSSACAYIALARHTRGMTGNTTAAATAVNARTGLTMGRASLALKHLEAAGLLSVPKRGTLRKLATWGEVLAAKAALTPRQQRAMDRFKRGAEPITASADPDYQAASALAQKDILTATDAPQGKPRFRQIEPDLVWLPNTLVDGFNGADAPLVRLRQMRDVRAIRLLLDVYRFSNLPENGGIHPSVIRDKFKRIDVGKRGPYTVWAFGHDGSSAAWDPLVTPFLGSRKTPEEREAASQEFWTVWGHLRTAGLIEVVMYLFEDDTVGAQALHACSIDHATDEEVAVGRAAWNAASRMVSEEQFKRAIKEVGTVAALVPVQTWRSNVQCYGIARPMHRPHTKKTGAWAATFLKANAEHAVIFEQLHQERERSVA